MSRGGIRNTIKDGALGVQGADATGIFGAIGVAAVPTGGIVILNDPEKARSLLRDSPLADMLVSALSIAKTTVYAIGLAGSINGTVGAVTAGTGNTGVGSVTVAGAPRNEYDVKLSILNTGGLNEAVFSYALDGIVSGQITIPADPGTYVIPNTGLTLTFVPGAPAGEEKSFVEGDTFTFKTTAPQISNAEVLTAVDTLLNSNYGFEWISIAGVSESALWASLAVKATGAEEGGKYIHFKVQARYLNDGETVDQWVAALTGSERGLTNNSRVQVYAAWIEEADAYGATDGRGGLGLASGMSARRNVHEHVDATKYGAIPGITKLLPAGITGAHIDALDNAGYTTFCDYPGETGIYITHGRTLAGETSDFSLEERRRVMDYALAKVRKAQFIYINSEVEVGADGSLEGLEMFKQISLQPLNNMKNKGMISDCEILIDEGQDILATQELQTRVRIIPLGKMTWIENVISYYNPNVGGA